MSSGYTLTLPNESKFFIAWDGSRIILVKGEWSCDNIEDVLKRIIKNPPYPLILNLYNTINKETTLLNLKGLEIDPNYFRINIVGEFE